MNYRGFSIKVKEKDNSQWIGFTKEQPGLTSWGINKKDATKGMKRALDEYLDLIKRKHRGEKMKEEELLKQLENCRANEEMFYRKGLSPQAYLQIKALIEKSKVTKELAGWFKDLYSAANTYGWGGDKDEQAYQQIKALIQIINV